MIYPVHSALLIVFFLPSQNPTQTDCMHAPAADSCCLHTTTYLWTVQFIYTTLRIPTQQCGDGWCRAVALHVRKMAAGTKRVRDDKEEVCVWDRNRCFMIQETSEERRAVKGSARRKTEMVSGQAEQRAGKWEQETGSSGHYWW
ncbi:hypothetical protein B0H14DRAFT_2577902 [Mycena olivaceomarginata]|nr:hypothetical protein B0H14DRAFT_2577902 [Mycena olivaceomarginata]